MLVYLKESMGYSDIDGRRIYGEYFARGAFGPTVVSRSFYYKNSNRLVEATIDSRWIKEKTGGTISFRFKSREINELSWDRMIELAKAIGIDYIGGRSNEERKGLKRAIINTLEQLQGASNG